MGTLLFARKGQLFVDLGDNFEEKENLINYLHSKLKVEITLSQNKLLLDSMNLSPQELQRQVVKFIYHRNLNTKHWASLDGKIVKVNNFKGANKKPEKHKKSGATMSVSKTWGL